MTTEPLSCLGRIGEAGQAVQLSCQVPVPSDFWPLLIQGLAAAATLAALAVAVGQTRNAKQTATKANEMTAEANEMTAKANEMNERANEFIIRQRDEARYRQASRVAAWIETDTGTARPRIYVENLSDDSIYNVRIINEFLGDSGEWDIPFMPPGRKKDHHLNNDPCILKQDEIAVAHIIFEDPIGKVYQRDPEQGNHITEIGPCWSQDL